MSDIKINWPTRIPQDRYAGLHEICAEAESLPELLDAVWMDAVDYCGGLVAEAEQGLENKREVQTWFRSHAETIAQNVIGQLIAFAILSMWGLPVAESLSLQAVFFVAAYVRGYAIRRFFERRAKLPQ